MLQRLLEKLKRSSGDSDMAAWRQLRGHLLGKSGHSGSHAAG